MGVANFNVHVAWLNLTLKFIEIDLSYELC